MKLGKAGKALIEKWEGRRATAYKDTAGLWTIGIGHLIKAGESHLLDATLTDVEIDRLFAQDVAWAEEATARLFPQVKRQNQFDALVSFVYNLGEPQVKSGTLDDLINANAPAEQIAAKWSQYVYSGGQRTKGLIARRADELRLYWSHLWKAVMICLVVASSLLVTTAILLIA